MHCYAQLHVFRPVTVSCDWKCAKVGEAVAEARVKVAGRCIGANGRGGRGRGRTCLGKRGKSYLSGGEGKVWGTAAGVAECHLSCHYHELRIIKVHINLGILLQTTSTRADLCCYC